MLMKRVRIFSIYFLLAPICPYTVFVKYMVKFTVMWNSRDVNPPPLKYRPEFLIWFTLMM